MYKHNLFNCGLVGLTIICIFSMTNVVAQSTYSNQNWFFGQSQEAISFTRPDSKATLTQSMFFTNSNTSNGYATANDPYDGNLLFYTDGQHVMDANHGLMDGISLNDPGNTLNSDLTKNQSVAITPVPGNIDQYYIFTNTNSGAINYSIVDMSINQNTALCPQGSVTSLNNPIANSTTNAADAMITLAKQDLSGYWLISLDAISNTYKVLDINGIDPTAWTESSYILGALMDASHMTFSSVNNKIAVAPKSVNVNVQILDFDLATGILSYDTDVINSGTTNTIGESVYDVEWSFDGTKLYISTFGDGTLPGDVLQFDTTDSIPTATLQSVLPSSVYRSYGLQIASDSSIYHLYQSSAISPIEVGRLSDTDSLAANTNYQPAHFGANVNFRGQQFPTFLPESTVSFSLSFISAGDCANTATTFYPTIDPPAQQVTWDFGDGNGSNTLAPLYTYTAAGTYSVSLTAILNNQPQTVTNQVTILDFDLQLTLPADTVACQCELPKYGPTCTAFSVTVQASGNAESSATYTWSNGQTGKTLTPDSAGFYYVVATVGNCQQYAGVNIEEYGASDQRANIWYFGQNAGIDFNPPTGAVALDDSAMDTPEGCTAISDRNGEILFYTNGDLVYDQTHTVIATGIGGSSLSSQSVIAVPFPNDETLYYIFTTEEINGSGGSFEFKYSIFDLKVNNGLGEIIMQNTTLYKGSTERIASNGSTVVIHEYGSNNFISFPITPNGIGTGIIYNTGSDHSCLAAEYGQGYMKFSPDGSKLAVAFAESTTGRNFVDVLEWSSGQFSNYETIDLDSDGASGLVYGVEFSPQSSKLFVTVKNTGGSSQLFEYRADSLDKIKLVNITSVGNELGAIQTGPDGQLYVAIEGSSTLGTILVDEDTVSNSTFNATGFTLAGGTSSHLGLPNFVQNFGQAASLPAMTVSAPTCVGQPIFLNATTSSIIDTVYWQITEIATNNTVFSSRNTADTLTINTAGDYLVSMLIGNRCGYDDAFSQTITINPTPTTNLPVAVSLCGTSVDLDATDPVSTNIAYLWNTGETTPIITASLIGTYTVTLTETVTGCTAQASTFVGPPFTVDLGPDQTVCFSQPLTLDCQANANSYTWKIDGVDLSPVNNQRTLDFTALNLVAGSYTVSVEVEDPIDPSCIVIDEAVITVNALPQFSAIEDSPVNACQGTDGSIQIDVTSVGSYTYFVSGSVTYSGSITGPGQVITPLSLPVGTYTVQLTDNVSNCIQQLSNIIVSGPAIFTVTSTPIQADCNNNGGITFELDTDVYPISYVVRDQVNISNAPITGNIATGGGISGLEGTIINILAGTYALEITDAGGLGCTVSNAPINILSTPTTDLVVNDNISACDNNLQIDLSAYVTSATASSSFFWTDDLANLPYNNISSAFVAPTPGNHQIYIIASTDGITTCDSIKQIDVSVIPEPIVTISIDDTNLCNGSVMLTAEISNDYTGASYDYRWSPVAINSPTITVSQTGTINYSVIVTNTLNQACMGTVNGTIVIPEPFTVSISNALACDDGSMFLITATSTNTNVDYNWFFEGAAINEPGSQIIDNREGVYSVTVVETASLCTAEASHEVIKLPVTPTLLSSALVFCPDDGAQTLDAGPNFISYLWNDGSTTRTIDITQGGIYSVSATNNFGCPTNDDSEVIEDCIPKVYGPNAFKPGGVNPEFSLFTEYLENFEIFIYNRWGELVYYSEDPAFKWDGTYCGKPLPAGQYTWVTRYTSIYRDSSEKIEKFGGVVLIR